MQKRSKEILEEFSLRLCNMSMINQRARMRTKPPTKLFISRISGVEWRHLEDALVPCALSELRVRSNFSHRPFRRQQKHHQISQYVCVCVRVYRFVYACCVVDVIRWCVQSFNWAPTSETCTCAWQWCLYSVSVRTLCRLPYSNEWPVYCALAQYAYERFYIHSVT